MLHFASFLNKSWEKKKGRCKEKEKICLFVCFLSNLGPHQTISDATLPCQGFGARVVKYFAKRVLMTFVMTSEASNWLVQEAVRDVAWHLKYTRQWNKREVPCALSVSIDAVIGGLRISTLKWSQFLLFRSILMSFLCKLCLIHCPRNALLSHAKTQ